MENVILSFDVGIVNLAYCILKRKDDKFEILKWDIINLDDNKIYCNHINKTKDKDFCNHNAKYQFNNNNLCNTHYKAFMKNFNKNLSVNFNHNKLDINDKVKCSQNKCKLYSEFNYNNNSYCNKHFEKIKKDFYSNNTPKKLKNQNSNYKSINNLAINLFNKLDNLKNDFLIVNEVLIENQPSLINPTMKTISTLLYSYFFIRGIIDKNITNSNIKNVLFISPQNKLKINKENTDNTFNNFKNNTDIENKTKRQEYVITKNLGKKYCKKLIENNDNYNKILNSYKKNDDLCDSFLQGFYYLFYKDSNIPKFYIDLLDEVNTICDKEIIDKEKKKIIKELTVI
jgi:hypothetical protein